VSCHGALVRARVRARVHFPTRSVAMERWNDELDDARELTAEGELKVRTRDDARGQRGRGRGKTRTNDDGDDNVSADDARLTVEARRNISGARAKVSRLRIMLETAKKGDMLETEYERRRDALDAVNARLDALVKRVSVRDKPKETEPSTSVASVYIERDGVNERTRAPMDAREVLQLQRDMLVEQDDALDDLSSAAQTAHHISLAVNDELDLHAKLLDGLEDDMEDTRAKLNVATRAIKRMMSRARESNCRALAWVVLVLLILVLILVLVVKLQR
jgi:syntaxin of plants SYP5